MITKIKIKTIKKLVVEIPRKELKNFKKGDEVEVEIRKVEPIAVPLEETPVVLSPEIIN